MKKICLHLVLAITTLGFGLNANAGSRGIEVFYRYRFLDVWGNLLDNPSVCSGRIAPYWAELNPAPGVYDWTSIDDKLQIAHDAGKTAYIRPSLSGYGGWPNPAAASGVPDWVYAQGGVEGVHYLDGPETRYPVFWTDLIKTNFQIFVEAFGARYDGHPDVEYILLGLYPEMGLGKDAEDLESEWLAAGYTDQLYEDTVKWYIDLYLTNFPNKMISMACLSGKPLPMTTARIDALRENITGYMNSKNTNGVIRTAIENNAMRDYSSWSFIQQYFRQYHESMHIVYEAIDKASGGGKAGDFRAMLENGLTTHADRFHIYYEDIVIATPGETGYDPEYESALAFAAAHIGIEPDDPACNDVWIRFNALDNATRSSKFFFQGLYCDANAPYDAGAWPVGKAQPSDGGYVPVSSVGSPVRECVRTSQATGDRYIYMDVDDRFISGGLSEVKIVIEYLDQGTDTFKIEYDGLAGAYASSAAVTKQNSGIWKTTTIHLFDAVFSNGQSGGNDLRINCNMDGDDYISFVQILKVHPPSDINGNGMPDVWEYANFGGTNAANGGAAEDFDGDGSVNSNEYMAGTSPTNASSVFTIDMSRVEDRLLVSFPALLSQGIGYEGLSRYYSIGQRTNLLLGAWEPVPGYSNIRGVDQTVVYTNDTIGSMGFYRIKAWLQSE